MRPAWAEWESGANVVTAVISQLHLEPECTADAGPGPRPQPFSANIWAPGRPRRTQRRPRKVSWSLETQSQGRIILKSWWWWNDWSQHQAEFYPRPVSDTEDKSLEYGKYSAHRTHDSLSEAIFSTFTMKMLD